MIEIEKDEDCNTSQITKRLRDTLSLLAKQISIAIPGKWNSTLINCFFNIYNELESLENQMDNFFEDIYKGFQSMRLEFDKDEAKAIAEIIFNHICEMEKKYSQEGNEHIKEDIQFRIDSADSLRKKLLKQIY